jgi:hypothetical protein
LHDGQRGGRSCASAGIQTASGQGESREQRDASELWDCLCAQGSTFAALDSARPQSVSRAIGSIAILHRWPEVGKRLPSVETEIDISVGFDILASESGSVFEYDGPERRETGRTRPASDTPAENHMKRITYSSIYASTRANVADGALISMLIALAALSGCTAVKVKLGTRVYLAKEQVTSMKASLPNGPAMAPGEKSPLVLEFAQPDGKTLLTEGKGKGKVLWQDITITPTVVAADNKGNLTLPHDPRKSDGKIAHVTITVPSHPDLKAELDIPITYDYNFTANFSGAPGTSGMNGSDGMAGSSGSTGSIDPNNPSPGGNGGNGTDGSSGGDGGNGGDAPDVQVRVTVRPGTEPLLQVSVTAAGKTRFYLVDPKGGALNILADGGAGGSGGRGGRGGAGGSGGSGTPSGSSGQAGQDGHSGFDGSPGRPGNISVRYDAAAKPYLAILHLSNSGGPAPVFAEAPVAPLW